MENVRLQETGLFHLAGASVVNFLLSEAAVGDESGFVADGRPLAMHEISSFIQLLASRTIVELAEADMDESDPLVTVGKMQDEYNTYLAVIMDTKLVNQVAALPDITDPRSVLNPLIELGRINPIEVIKSVYALYTGQS